MFKTFKAKVLKGKAELVGKEFMVKINDYIDFIGGERCDRDDLVAQTYLNGDVLQVRTLKNYYELQMI